MDVSGTFVSDNTNGIFVYQAMENAVNMYNEVNLDDPSLNREITNWVMFDCYNDKCKRAYGYVKSNENTPKYYLLPHGGEANNKLVTLDGADGTPQYSTCGNTDANGLLMSDGSLCIVGHASTPTTGTMEAGSVYVCDVASTSPFAASGIHYIKTTENTFTYSTILADEAIGVHLFTGGKEIQSSKITDGAQGNKTKLSLYNCNSTGVCTLIAGYAINEDKYYSISTTPASDVVNPTRTNVCTYDSGNLIDDGTGVYLCVDGTNKISILRNGYFALGDDAFSGSSPFVNANKKNMIQISDTFIGINYIYSGKILFKFLF